MGALNMNMNMKCMNMNMGAPGTSVGGAGTRVRFNTMDYRKYVSLDAMGNVNEAIIPTDATVMRFPAYWDADLRAYEYLNEFLIAYPDWRTLLGSFVSSTTLVSPHLLSPANLRFSKSWRCSTGPRTGGPLPRDHRPA